MRIARRSNWGLVGSLLLLFLAFYFPRISSAQSRRLLRLQAELARQPQPSRARERALWALAWEKEVPPARQDSLVTAAARLAAQLSDSTGLLVSRVAAARQQLAAGQRTTAQATLGPVLAAARRRGDTWPELLALIQLGRSYWATAAHPRALACWQQAWTVAQRQPDAYWQVRTALLQANAGPGYAQGLHWYFIGLRLAEQSDCQVCQADALNGIGYNYSLLGEWALATRYTQQALRQHQALRNADGEYGSLIGLANLQSQQAQYPAALVTYLRAKQFLHSPQDSLPVVTGLASTYVALGRYALAKAQARLGLAIARRLGNRALQEEVNLTLASATLRQGRADSAVYYGRRAWAQRPRTGGQTTASTCQVLAQAYAARGDFATAYAFQRRAQAYGDTLTGDKIRNQAAQARYRYELEKQQRQIAQLERDRALGRLQHQQQLALTGLAGLLLLALGGGVLWAVRRRQRRRVAALRAQLATDLHDEVGTLLTRVSVQAELLQSLPPAQQAPAVAGLLRNSRAAASTMRDVVWGIDARADSAGSLLDRMREYLHQTVGTAGWQTELEVSGWPDEVPLPAAVRQAVYRIFKEAVTNALRHAPGATHLHVALSRRRGQLHLTIADNGQPPTAAPGPATGMGLRNMQQRAAALGGHASAGPRPAGGWQVRVQVPVPD
jgi:signal transduction histidine kinase